MLNHSMTRPHRRSPEAVAALAANGTITNEERAVADRAFQNGWDAVVPPARFFHGTTAILEPGDTLVPGGPSGVTQNHRCSEPGRVYVTSRCNTARDYAEQFGGHHVYEVEPYGLINTYPGEPFSYEHTCASAVIRRRLYDDEINSLWALTGPGEDGEGTGTVYWTAYISWPELPECSTIGTSCVDDPGEDDIKPFPDYVRPPLAILRDDFDEPDWASIPVENANPHSLRPSQTSYLDTKVSRQGPFDARKMPYPIPVIHHDGVDYVLDGHHTVANARRTGKEIPIQRAYLEDLNPGPLN